MSINKNILVGKIVNDDNTQGTRIATAGLISASRDNNVPLILNRSTTDGGLVQFRRDGTNIATFNIGTGSPLGNISAPPGSIYLNGNGGAGATFFVKESGTGNTGWVAK